MKNIIIILIFTLISHNVSFCQSPITDFTYDIKKVNCDYYITDFYYNSSSTADADSCCWNFGDGAIKCRSYTNAASHNYSKPGTYSVTLTLWKDGIESNITKNDLVTVSIPPTPNFELIISDSNWYAPLSIIFQNTTELGDCEVLNYTWDFGDGNSSHDINPEYIFDNPNTYYVSLNVTDTLGCEKEYYDYVVVKDTAQNGEFEFINTSCISEFELSPCGYDKHYKLLNDSLIVYGFYSGNCGTLKTATIRYNGDTVKIKTWEVGPLTTCSCGYCFEIVIPNITQDSSIVVFNGDQISSELNNILEQNFENFSIKIFPNPVNDYLNINIEGTDLLFFEFKLIDIDGRVIKTGKLNCESQIELKDIESGFYLLNIYDKSKNKEFISRFIKE